MDSKNYYYQLIDESYIRINKYEKQLSGLRDFQKECQKGSEQFLLITSYRRRNISDTLNGRLLRQPMIKKLNTRLSNAVDDTYESNVLNCFQGVEEDILTLMEKIENQLEEEYYNISYYERRIYEIGEEIMIKEAIKVEE